MASNFAFDSERKLEDPQIHYLKGNKLTGNKLKLSTVAKILTHYWLKAYKSIAKQSAD